LRGDPAENARGFDPAAMSAAEWVLVLVVGWLTLSLLAGLAWTLAARELRRRHRRHGR
jgi:hypothetical protein